MQRQVVCKVIWSERLRIIESVSGCQIFSVSNNVEVFGPKETMIYCATRQLQFFFFFGFFFHSRGFSKSESSLKKRQREFIALLEGLLLDSVLGVTVFVHSVALFALWMSTTTLWGSLKISFWKL